MNPIEQQGQRLSKLGTLVTSRILNGTEFFLESDVLSCVHCPNVSAIGIGGLMCDLNEVSLT